MELSPAYTLKTKKKRGIAPIVAVLLAVIVAVALAMIYYAWVFGLLGGLRAAIEIESVGWSLEVYNTTQWGLELNACHTCHNATYSSLLIDMSALGKTYCYECHNSTNTDINETYLFVYEPRDDLSTYDDYAMFNTDAYWDPGHGLTGANIERCTKCHDVHTGDVFSVIEDREINECWTCHNYTVYGSGSTQTHGEVLPAHANRTVEKPCEPCHGLKHGGLLNTIVVSVRNKGEDPAYISKLVIDGREYNFTVVGGDVSDAQELLETGLQPDERVDLATVEGIDEDTRSLLYFRYTSGQTYRIEVFMTTGIAARVEETAP